MQAGSSVPTNGARILVFFLGYMGLFVLLVPAILLWLWQERVGSLDWPPPAAVQAFGPEWAVADGQFRAPARLLAATGPVVDARSVVPGAKAAAASVNSDGTLAAAAVGPGDMGAALAANYRVSSRAPGGAAGDAVQTIDGMQGVLRAEPGRALIVLGTDRALAEARAAQAAQLTTVAAGPPPKVASPAERQLALAFLGFWVVLQLFLFGRVAAWAGSVPPPAGVAAVGAAELRTRLKGLAELEQPFTVVEGDDPDRLVADWKWYDARWLDLMRLRSARRVHRIVLELDPATRTVRAQDRSAAVDWSAGVDGARLAWKAERGIRFFEFQAGREIGIFVEDGVPKLRVDHAWRFDLADMKQPLIRIVREAGWTWRPVVTFVRAFGG